ncbi:DUF2314 domain-containing protein [uncultured Maribacter sp.]|uniref:YegJ family protein n=1 Tax=uncultured Maribacter sp. TaxID=431308 RepID=UPI0030ECE098|tara:strand:- start:18727 stop:19233 length:507 start_codon:yes stop_codon:yes gene_type:complete
MKTTFTYITIVLLLFSSCKENRPSKVERDGEPNVYNIENDNAKINDAIEKAKNSIQEFTIALKSDNPDLDFFAIKQKFITRDGGGEHIWVQDIQLVDSEFIGTIGNEPVYTNAIQLGDTITVDRANISDWMYYEKDKIVGGYTIRVLRDGLSDEEKAQFDAKNGLLFK